MVHDMLLSDVEDPESCVGEKAAEPLKWGVLFFLLHPPVMIIRQRAVLEYTLGSIYVWVRSSVWHLS
jgi:hypothetical protein